MTKLNLYIILKTEKSLIICFVYSNPLKYLVLLNHLMPSQPANSLALLFYFLGINSVHIVQIEGPEVLKAGAELRLDCDYDYMAEEEPQLDLKWYFNKSPIPVITL